MGDVTIPILATNCDCVFLQKKLKKTHQAKPHAESEQTADVGDERRPGHPLVADDVRRKRVLGSTLKIFLLRH